MKNENERIQGIRNFLECMRHDLVRALRRPDGIAIEKSPELMDEMQYALDRDLAILAVDLESNLLREVNDALERIDTGDFGTCVECEEVIGPRRLAAVPWASRCIRCQEDADLRAQEELGYGPERLRRAA